MEISKILWPTDYSENAAKALPMLNSLADKYNAEVMVLHVTEEINRWEHLEDMLGRDNFKHLREKAREYSSQRLEETCEKYMTECRLFKKQIVVGEAAEEILNAVEREGVDMVVMATHGRSGLKRLAYGSVVDRVVRDCPVPVVTVR